MSFHWGLPDGQATAIWRETEAAITASASSSCAAEGLWRTTATGTAPVQSPFRDVANSDWFFDPVMYVVERGLFQGTSGTTFEPMSTMSRSMLVTVLYRLAGQPAVTGTNPFSVFLPGPVIQDAVTGCSDGDRHRACDGHICSR